MEIFSRYLSANIEISVDTIKDGEEEFLLVPHNSLVDIIYHNPICRANGVKVEFKESTTNTSRHFVWSCIISDNAGYCVEEIGESTPESLTNQVSKAYPSLMAHKRAFDAAALVFLHLPSEMKIYSKEQFSNRDAQAQAVVDEYAPATESAAVENHTESAQPESLPANTAPVTVVTNPETEKKEAVNNTTNVAPPAKKVIDPIDSVVALELDESPEATTAALEDIVGTEPPAEMWEKPSDVDLTRFDVVVTFGRHKGKTVREIYDANAGYVAYLADKAQDTELRQICKDYLAFKKEQEA